MSTDDALDEESQALRRYKDETTRQHTALQAAAGRTLLPWPIASAVSGITGATSLTVRVGSKIGGWWIAGAREATLTGLEIGRATVEIILTSAGRDVSKRSSGDLGREEAEGILERSITTLHSTIATLSFFTSAGFYLSSAALNSATAVSIQGLSTLNAILGDTESSRAVAAILTLLRDEFTRPGIIEKGEALGYLDLLMGLVGFVLLQRWGRRKTELEFRATGGEEVIWDTVIDDKGFRADVVGTRRTDYFSVPKNPTIGGSRRVRPVSFISPAGDEEINTLERATLSDFPVLSVSPEDQARLSDAEIREHIINQLPPGARAVIKSETITAKTIKVDIYNTNLSSHIEAPPGTVMIAETLHHTDEMTGHDLDESPHQTVVFRTAIKRSSSADIEPHDRLRMTISEPVDDPMDTDELVMMKDSTLRRRGCDNFEDTGEGSDTEESNGTTLVVLGSQQTSANQKKSRKTTLTPAKNMAATKNSPSKSSLPLINGKSKTAKQEKSGTFKKALKSLSPSQSSTAIKDSVMYKSGDSKRATTNGGHTSIPRMTPTKPKDQQTNNSRPQLPSHRSYNGHLNNSLLTPVSPHSSSRQNFITVHEQRKESIVAHTDTYSVHSLESRPGSPTFTRTLSRTTSGFAKSTSDVDMAVWNAIDDQTEPSSPIHQHQRSTSFVPSLYSMTRKNSEEEIILIPKDPMPQQSIFDDQEILITLAKDGKVPGIFPDRHLVHNIRRYSRFSSASYGSNFLRVMGLREPDKTLNASRELQVLDTMDIHREHSSFADYTGLPSETILISGFMDPLGLKSAEWSPSVISPLMHFVSVDRDMRAVVLTCRGTLGFEDVLTDLMAGFDDIRWRDRTYKVHQGVHASARRLLGADGSRVMATIKEALEEFPDFGLVLCGHSLGGAVAALLAVLIAEPSSTQSSGVSFVTAPALKLLRSSENDPSRLWVPPIALPSGRPIHVYAFGTPPIMSPELRLATRGLITTVVNHADIVPSLSLGIPQDFRCVALSLKTDTEGGIAALRARVWQRIRHALQSAFYVDAGPPPPENAAGDGLGEDTWAWSTLKTLRAGMKNQKLVPPGEVFVIETSRVFDRQQNPGAATTSDSATERVYRSLGRPATRVQLKLIRNVEERFGELRFGSHMFSDHFPGRYEANLAALEKGILEP